MTTTLTSAIVCLLLINGIAGGADSVAPLVGAAKQQDWTTLSELLTEQVDVNQAEVDGMTALHWAVYHDAEEIVKRLIEAGVDVNRLTHYDISPLSLACLNGNAAVVDALLAAGADAQATLRGGETLLMTAARTGKLGPVRSLLAAGAKVDATERKGQTALMWAAAEGHAEVVSELVKAGADLHAPLASGFNAWFFAVREGKSEVVDRLLAAGVDVNEVMQPKRPGGRTPRAGTSALLLAVENGHFELAVKLLDAGAEPSDVRCGYTALHAVTWVRKPIRGDGDPSPQGSGVVGSLDVVRALVKKGADVNARYGEFKGAVGRLNYTGATPFLMAAETGDVPLLRLLVELGADPMLSNVDRCTPLLAACGVGVLSDGDESAGTEEDAIEAVAFLIEMGADINAVDDQGNTVMHGAAYTSWFKLVPILARYGADADTWNRQNKLGWTPLEIAQGHRPGNFRPSPETVVAIEAVQSSVR